MKTLTEAIETTEKALTTAPVRYQVQQADWSEYLKLRAQKSSLEKAIKTVESRFNLPTAEEFATQAGLTHEDKVTVEIVNGNGQYVGKFTVSYMPEKTVRDYWMRRIS